ncbi:MAG: GDSL-type esterase/lipase family protein [Bryobacter sp.]|nr:GDSL-type esterase/lipase family protein [Bryobacter sp.]
MKFLALFALLLPLPAAELLPPGAGIERTMGRLAACKANNPDTVRILFYGQSITKQAWWRTVADYLRQRFPACKLVIENRAIGGYSTPRLVRTMEADILPFHPDLVIFHDYGPEDLYEQIILWVRAHTTADILLQSDHDTGRNVEAQDKHSFAWMPALARKYGLGLVDIRGGWQRHLRETGKAPKDLLRDNVHLNADGEALYAQLTIAALVDNGQRPAPYFEEFPIGPDRMSRSDELTLDFVGTRVELLDGIGGPLQVFVDGKPPAVNPALYYHSRPTNTWDADWPGIMHIGRTPNAFPYIEEWTLKVTAKKEPNGLKHDFELYGSRTGPDGKGNNKQPFRSISGRVTIAPEDYDIERAYGLRKIDMPNSWQVRWATLPRFVDPYLPVAGPTTVVYGLKPGKHRLVLRGPGRVARIRIYNPPLAKKENPKP